jgi:hypothetical protein
MSRSNALRVRDVRAAFGLVGDCLDALCGVQGNEVPAGEIRRRRR